MFHKINDFRIMTKLKHLLVGFWRAETGLFSGITILVITKGMGNCYPNYSLRKINKPLSHMVKLGHLWQKGCDYRMITECH